MYTNFFTFVMRLDTLSSSSQPVPEFMAMQTEAPESVHCQGQCLRCDQGCLLLLWQLREILQKVP